MTDEERYLPCQRCTALRQTITSGPARYCGNCLAALAPNGWYDPDRYYSDDVFAGWLHERITDHALARVAKAVGATEFHITR